MVINLEKSISKIQTENLLILNKTFELLCHEIKSFLIKSELYNYQDITNQFIWTTPNFKSEKTGFEINLFNGNSEETISYENKKYISLSFLYLENLKKDFWGKPSKDFVGHKEYFEIHLFESLYEKNHGNKVVQKGGFSRFNQIISTSQQFRPLMSKTELQTLIGVFGKIDL